MQASVVKSFLPWIIFSILISVFAKTPIYASLGALLSILIINRWALKHGFFLDWASVLFFATLSEIFYFHPIPWLSINAFFISNVVLAAALWLSLLIKKPFTTPYAKLKVDKLYWDTPLFKAVNFYLSLSWCLLLSFVVGLSLITFYFPKESAMYLDIIAIALMILGVILTRQFPGWYIGRHFWRSVANIAVNNDNPYLQGDFAPVIDEIDVANLPILGQLPTDLHGVYLRNGANPRFTPISYTYPLDGDGMIHEISIHDGQVSYRNRFVKTRGLQAELNAGKTLYAGIRYPIPPDPRLIGKHGDNNPVKNGAFIHIIPFKEHYLALYEAGFAYVLNTSLQTLGEWKPNGYAIPVNAHTRKDPDTGELHFISYHIDTPNLTCYRFNSEGNLNKEFTVARDHCAMVHDFVLTEHYWVIFNCPAIFNLDTLVTDEPLLTWQPNLGTLICLINRKKPDDVLWIKTDAFFTFHFINAYEQNEQMIIDHVRHLEPIFMEHQERSTAPHLCRTTIDLVNNKVTHQQLSSLSCEFPRMNEAYLSKPHRYAYVAAKLPHSQTIPGLFDRLVKYDYQQQIESVYVFGEGFEIDEPIFVTKPDANTEDDGYIMVYVYDSAKQQSQLAIFSALNLQAPIVYITLPRRVPHGLHGSWVASS